MWTVITIYTYLFFPPYNRACCANEDWLTFEHPLGHLRLIQGGWINSASPSGEHGESQCTLGNVVSVWLKAKQPWPGFIVVDWQIHTEYLKLLMLRPLHLLKSWNKHEKHSSAWRKIAEVSLFSFPIVPHLLFCSLNPRLVSMSIIITSARALKLVWMFLIPTKDSTAYLTL